MTESKPSQLGSEIRSASEFQNALTDLVERADSNDVEVRGGWVVDGLDGTYDVEVTAVVRPD